MNVRYIDRSFFLVYSKIGGYSESIPRNVQPDQELLVSPSVHASVLYSSTFEKYESYCHDPGVVVGVGGGVVVRLRFFV